jgi:hypothetical protein
MESSQVQGEGGSQAKMPPLAQVKPEAGSQGSEVARILEQIRLEYESAHLGMSGSSYGSTKHSFITARMEMVSQLHEKLSALVGDGAIGLVINEMNQIGSLIASPDKGKIDDNNNG